MLTKTEKRNRLQKLRDRINELVNTVEIISYHEWKKMDPAKKFQVRKAWEAYFEKCRNGISARNFRGLMKAYKEHNVPEIHGRMEFAKKLQADGVYRNGRRKDTIPEPSIFPYDPELLFHLPKVVEFLTINKQYDKLNNELSDGMDF